MLTRVAASHIRVGTIQWAAAHQDREALAGAGRLHAARDITPSSRRRREPYVALFDAILERQAALIARWQLVGFIHGVMNTDNMALSGETIDYGPCAFMDALRSRRPCSARSITAAATPTRNQPPIAHWNLARLAEAMVPLFDDDVDRAVERATSRLDRFPGLFEQHWLNGMRAKLGLFTAEDGDKALVGDLLDWMHDRSADFTNTFVSLTRRAAARGGRADPDSRPGIAAGWSAAPRQPQPAAGSRA